MLFIFSTRDLNRSEALGAMKNQLSASWTRAACSCVSITLPASS